MDGQHPRVQLKVASRRPVSAAETTPSQAGFRHPKEPVMPHLIPTSDSETPALLALRRTLWQLAFLGILAAAAVARIAPQSGVIALWCALVPLSALAAHFRSTLLDMLPLHRSAGV
ncbi:MAG: hypothetical protein Q8929_20160, partial [Bacillota bacterium]|nr:hypothetical protein [Bacillota bacterium]